MRNSNSLIRTTTLLVGLLILALVFADGQEGRAEGPGEGVESRFDESADGWGVWNNARGVWHEAGGYLSAAEDGSSRVWYWLAPAQFLGNQHHAYGKSLLIEARDDGAPDRDVPGPQVVLEGAGRSLGHFGAAIREPGAEWDTWQAQLATERGWVNLANQRPATDLELRAVLSGLERLLIRGTRHTRAQRGDLRRVALGVSADAGVLAPRPAPGPKAVLRLTGLGEEVIPRVKNLLDFGKVAQGGDFKIKSFTAHNDGELPLELAVPEGLAPQLEWVDVPWVDFGLFRGVVIPPGGSVVLSLRFSETEVLTSTAKRTFKLPFRSNDKKKSGKPVINVWAESAFPIQALPSPVEFGALPAGQSLAKSVTLKNLSVEATHTFSVGIISVGSPEFVLTGGTQFTLAPEATTTITVEFRPRDTGKAIGSLHIVAGSGLPAATLAVLSGTGKKGSPPDLVLRPSPLDFGDVPPGTSEVLSLEIGNAGGTALKVTLPRTLPAPFSWASPPGNRLTIGPLDAVEVTVLFAPTLPGPFLRTMTLQTNDPDRRQASLELTGAGATGPQLLVEPESIDFGNVPRFQRTERTVTVTNISGGPVSVIVSGTLGNQEEWHCPTQSLILPAGGELVLTVAFTPLQLGARTSDLLILVSQPGPDPEFHVPLSGVGVTPGKPRPKKRSQ